MNDQQLYLIDGHALIYRAYFAFIRNPLTNSKGQPTSAVFGFANYLVRLIETYKCPYLAVAMDSSKPTFRHEVYEQYKANREEMPDDLKSQIPLVRELIDAFNIPVVKQDGLEADDLIAALTVKAIAADFDVFLVTKDKDLMQLVGPRVKMLSPEGTGVLQEINTIDVVEKMGVGPDRIVDYLALIGDASDNIPGVPGVGPKTAVKILETAGSVDALLKDVSILANEKLIAKIEENRDRLIISKQLATLKTDADPGVELNDLKKRDLFRDRCLAIFRELEFSSLLKNPLFGGAPRLHPETLIAGSISDVKSFADLIGRKGSVSIDTQTTSLLPRAALLVGISLAIDTEKALYIPVGHTGYANIDLNETLAVLKPLIESPGIIKYGQNIKYDCEVFKNYGICLRGIGFDSMVAAYLVEPGKREYDLNILASEWLSMETTGIETLIGREPSFASVPVEKAAPFAVEAVVLPLVLKEKIEPVIRERNLENLLRTIELPLIPVLADIEWHGMLVDTSFLSGLSREYTIILDRIAEEIHTAAGGQFNLNSPRQISEVLFDKLCLPKTKRTKNGGHSTNVDELEKLADDFPIVRKILEYREVQKLLSTYIDALPGQILASSGRIHSSFNQTITATGRLSSTSPNLQNIPIRTEAGRKIRQAFIAGNGCRLVVADYSQIELRILAHLSRDPFLIQAFMEDKDIHTQTASAIYGVFPEMVTPEMRRAAKTINFGLMYGMGPVNLSRQLGISFTEAKSFIETYFKQFPTIRDFMEETIRKARESGYTETLLGRRRYLPEINAAQRTVRETAERTAINTPVQGTAADIIKIAMINIHNEMESICPESKMLLQVHDELVFEVPSDQAPKFSEWVAGRMAGAYTLTVPIKVDMGIGSHWGEAH